MIEQRVEKHIISKTSPYFKMLDRFCLMSKNLYNTANYLIRQELFRNGKWLRYEDLDKILKQPDNCKDYRNMPCAVSAQQTLRSLDSVWKAYFKSHKDWKLHPDKYLGEPCFPKYKDKLKGRHPIYLTSQTCAIKDNNLCFPKVFEGLNIKLYYPTVISSSEFRQCRILSCGNHIVIEVVYNIETAAINNDSVLGRYIGIDLGLDNLAAVSNNVGAPFYIIDGKGLKSINRYWNKLYAEAKSTLMNQPKKRYESNKTMRLTYKRNQKINDYLHKASRWIVNFANQINVNTIIIGKNNLWKQNINLGSKTNQKFVQIPHARLIDMIKYKANERGIKVVCVEESYTSKTSFLDEEDPIKHESYAGTRTYRGLFRTATGLKINADSNGAMQIIKKYAQYSVQDTTKIRICLQRPIRLNVS